MKHKDQLKTKLQESFNLQNMMPIILFLLVILLLSLTWPVWLGIFNKIKVIFLPFAFGFLIAYILRPLVVFFEHRRIPRSISVTVASLAFISLVVLLIYLVLPSMINDLGKLAESLVDGLTQVFNLYKSGSGVESPLLDSVLKQVVDGFDSIVSSLGDLPLIASGIIGKILSSLTFIIFSLVIAVYFIFDYEKVSKGILTTAESVSPKLASSIIVVDEAVSSYLKSFALIIPIIAIEYSLMYFLLGHSYALILGILTALSLLIPYIGPMIIHTIGIITALSMPRSKLFILILALIVLSNIDGYVTGPLVYSKRNKVDPLWSLFAFFAASTLLGFIGVLISLPLYLSIRAVLQLRTAGWDLKIYQESRVL